MQQTQFDSNELNKVAASTIGFGVESSLAIVLASAVSHAPTMRTTPQKSRTRARSKGAEQKIQAYLE